MKTIRTFVFVVIPVVCAACATEQPRTISALPEPPTEQDMQNLQRLPDGNYPGYQRIMVDGQERFCRQIPRALLPENRILCLTEPELRTVRLLARELAPAQQPSSPVSGDTGLMPATVGPQVGGAVGH